jgi:hypothetical protein
MLILFLFEIERLQKQVYDLGAPTEDDLFIQLSGLKQVNLYKYLINVEKKE